MQFVKWFGKVVYGVFLVVSKFIWLITQRLWKVVHGVLRVLFYKIVSPAYWWCKYRYGYQIWELTEKYTVQVYLVWCWLVWAYFDGGTLWKNWLLTYQIGIAFFYWRPAKPLYNRWMNLALYHGMFAGIIVKACVKIGERLYRLWDYVTSTTQAEFEKKCFLRDCWAHSRKSLGGSEEAFFCDMHLDNSYFFLKPYNRRMYETHSEDLWSGFLALQKFRYPSAARSDCLKAAWTNAVLPFRTLSFHFSGSDVNFDELWSSAFTEYNSAQARFLDNTCTPEIDFPKELWELVGEYLCGDPRGPVEDFVPQETSSSMVLFLNDVCSAAFPKELWALVGDYLCGKPCVTVEDFISQEIPPSIPNPDWKYNEKLWVAYCHQAGVEPVPFRNLYIDKENCQRLCYHRIPNLPEEFRCYLILLSLKDCNHSLGDCNMH